ncbi:hypothetical protein D3C72_2251070 [compost metagenome]
MAFDITTLFLFVIVGELKLPILFHIRQAQADPDIGIVCDFFAFYRDRGIFQANTRIILTIGDPLSDQEKIQTISHTIKPIRNGDVAINEFVFPGGIIIRIRIIGIRICRCKGQ